MSNSGLCILVKNTNLGKEQWYVGMLENNCKRYKMKSFSDFNFINPLLRIIITLNLFFGSIYQVISQSKDAFGVNVVPPTPNAAALGKYGDIPVSYYTGLPNISIPLYVVKSGTLSLPISLSYHASGIKVEEISSNVGLGWSLSGAGVITHSVRGIDDHSQNGFPAGKLLNQSVSDILSLPSTDTRKRQLLDHAAKGDIDLEPDLYYFNFGTYSGKFFYDQNGEIHTIPRQKIKIETETRAGIGDIVWIITDEQGIRYEFAETEWVNSRANCNGNDSNGDSNSLSSWYLTRILSPDRKWEISLEYEPYGYSLKGITNSTKYILSGGNSAACNKPADENCTSTNTYSAKRLKQVNFSQGKVVFVPGADRCDLQGDKALGRIEIYVGGTLLNKFLFTYDYFISPQSGQSQIDLSACNGHVEAYKFKRLKLLSLKEEAEGVSKPPYRFQYNPSPLPHRLSYAQDHWGYYNGILSNATLVPTFDYRNQLGHIVTVPGANREVSAGATMASVLTSIIYPTGGKTTFDYEGNTIHAGEEKIDRMQESILLRSNEGIPASTVSQTASFSIDNPPHNIINGNNPAGGVFIGMAVTIKCNPSVPDCPACETPNADCTPPEYHCIPVGTDSNCGSITIRNTSTGEIRTFTASVNNFYLPNGAYELRVHFPSNGVAYPSYYVAISWDKKVPEYIQYLIQAVGGLRVRSIKDAPDATQAPLVKNYRYHRYGHPTSSSGSVVSKPVYEHDYSVYSPVNGGETCSYVIRKSYSNIPLGGTLGGIVGYENVTVELGANGEQGASEYSYTAPAAFPDGDDVTSFPFPPTTSYDWRRGLLLSSVDYKKVQGQLKPVREISNEYATKLGAQIIGMKVIPELSGLGAGGSDSGGNGFQSGPLPSFATYNTDTEFQYLKRTTEKMYDQQGNKAFETVREYEYGSNHLQLIMATTTNSKMEKLISRMKYVDDYIPPINVGLSLQAQGIVNMAALHIPKAIVEKYEVKEANGQSQVVSGILAQYKTNVPYPDQVFSLEVNASLSLGTGSRIDASGALERHQNYSLQGTFERYDNKGNIVQVRKRDGIPVAYVWGYKQEYLIAEIHNATYDEVLSALNMTEAQVNEWTDETARLTMINGLRSATAMRKALITTYTYKATHGVSSVTDPNNSTTYYEYDGFGRLRNIKDYDRNNLKKFMYNYQNLED
jgi:YD repeat-containing protein